MVEVEKWKGTLYRKKNQNKNLEKCSLLNSLDNFKVTKIVVKTKQLTPQFFFNVGLTFNI